MLRNWIVDWEIARQRHLEFERAAEIDRLLAAARRGQPGLAERWLFAVGSVLIDLGCRLRRHALARTQPQVAL